MLLLIKGLNLNMRSHDADTIEGKPHNNVLPTVKTGTEAEMCSSHVEETKHIETSKSFLTRLLDEEKLKYCQECGICTGSCQVAWLVPNHYNPRILLQKGLLDLREGLKQVGLWLCARCYRCYSRCPQMLDLPEIFSLMRNLAVESDYLPDPASKVSEALKLIQEEIPLPAVYAWLCLYPQTKSEHKKVDKMVIEALEHFVADRKNERPAQMPRTRKEKIAIVGSGPAGLTASYELVKRGYSVKIFESLPEAGGMLRVGIPIHRLPREVLQADLDYIEGLGVDIQNNTTGSKDFAIDGLLKEGYAAVFIATGSHKSVELNLEGKELEGVFQALDLFRRLSMGEKISLGEKVAVVGGGDVAIDAARTALRLGAKEVHILYRRSRVEMPANPSEVREAEKEEVKIHFLVNPTKILGKNGRVTGINCIRMELGELDETGRRRPISVEGSDYTIEIDTVILAIGETSDLSFLPKDVIVSKNNTIAVDPITLETSLPRIFAGGDVVSGPASVIEAVAAGKRVADSIDKKLRGENIE